MIDTATRQRWADILRAHGFPPIRVHVTYDYSLPEDAADAVEFVSDVPKGYMNAAAACGRLGCSRPQLTKYIQRGYIAGVRHRRAGLCPILVFASAAVLRLRALLDEFAGLRTRAKGKALAAAMEGGAA